MEAPLDFEELVRDALDALPDDLRTRLSNVAVVVEDEPPFGQPLLGLYQGVPLTRRSSFYGGVLRTRSRSSAARSSGSTAATLRGSSAR